MIEIEELVSQGKELHASVKSIETRLHGLPEGFDKDGRDASFSSHLETVKGMVEERVRDHDTETEEGAILRSMELCLATHGIFDAAVASALVPLCADISPDLADCLMRFRVKQAELVSELANCTTRMNELRKSAVQEAQPKTSHVSMQRKATTLSLEVPESEEDTFAQSEQQQLSAASTEGGSSGSGSPRLSSNMQSARAEKVSSARDPHPRISPGRHFDGEPSPRKHHSRGSSPSPPAKAGSKSPSSPSRKGWSPAIFKQRMTIPSPKRVVVSQSSPEKYKGTLRLSGSRSGSLESEDPSVRNSRIYNSLLSVFWVDDEEAELEAKFYENPRTGSPGADSKLVDDTGDASEKLKIFRSYVKSAYPLKKMSSKRLGLRDILYTVDKLIQSKKVADEKVLARALEARKDAEVVERLKSSLAANEASGQLSKLSAQQQLKLRNHENDPSKVRIVRVDTMEAHLYKHFEKRYGVVNLAAEHAAIFMRSLEYYAAPAEPHLGTGTKQAGGLYHDRKHTSHTGDGICRTFLSILLNEVDESFYEKQKDRQGKVYELLKAEIRRDSPNLNAPQAQTRLNAKLHGWMSEVEYLYFVKALFGEEELLYEEEEEEEEDGEDYRHEPSFSKGLSRSGIALADALDRGKQRRQGLVVSEENEVDDAVALYDGRAARRHARGGRVSAPLMLLLKKLATEEREREVEAATVSKVVDKSNGSLGNHATMSYLTYHTSVLSSPVKKLRKSQMVHEAWDDDNKGSKVRTTDFINTVLIYQLVSYVEYLMPLRQAFHARDHLNMGVLATNDIVKLFYEDLQHRDYHVLPNKHSASNVRGTFGGLRPGSTEAAMVKKSHDTARQRALNDLLRRIFATADPHQASVSTFSELVKGFITL